MSSGNLLTVQPSELKFLFELGKPIKSYMVVTNKTNKHFVFKVKTTNPRKYSVLPNSGVLLPGNTLNITVTMVSQNEMPHDLHCKDKFLLLSVLAPDGVRTANDITAQMFFKMAGRIIDEVKLRVVYVPANRPSPVPEEPEEESPPTSSFPENVRQNLSSLDWVSKVLEMPKQKSSETWSMISKLNEEKASALHQNQRLLQDLEFARKGPKRSSEFSSLMVAIVGLLGVLIGYFITNKK